MTLRTLVGCASPLAAGHTVREHLSAIDCADLGTGGDCASFSTRASFAVKRQMMAFHTNTREQVFKAVLGAVPFGGGTETKMFGVQNRKHYFKIGDCDG